MRSEITGTHFHCSLLRNALTYIIALTAAGVLAGSNNAFASTVWLDELDISKCKSDYHPAQKNKAATGKPLTIGGRQFERGLGVVAPSAFRISLAKGAKRFTACVGMDDSVVPGWSDYVGRIMPRFSIIGDDKKILWNSNTMKPGQSANIDIDLAGVDEIELVVETPFPVTHSALVDWADARFEVQGAKPRAMDIKPPKPYILTPKSSPKPQINGAEILGVRPQRPLFYRIAATGQRPMTFSIVGLPDGLSLDGRTGIMTGRISKAGSYKMTLTAKNSLGKTSREFTIVAGDKLCLTPPMGWNAWNCWGENVDGQKVRRAAKKMVESGLADHGWTYINIDDCWEGKRDPKTGEIAANDKFGDMKALAYYVHGLGLKSGLYTDAGRLTCAKFEGSEGHEYDDVMTYAKWGFDYVKVDWCYCEHKDPKQTFSKFSKAIAQADRDIVLSICGGGGWLFGEKAGVNCWRTTGDLFDTWEGVLNGFAQSNLWPYAGPGHWNDYDMLVIGKVGWGIGLHQTHITPDEQYTHVSLWCLLASPLFIGCDMDSLDEFTLSLLSNDEVIAVNQDSLGRQAKQIRAGDEQVWVKDMKDGSKAIGLFNLTAVEKTCGFKLADAGLSGECIARDLWRQKNIGIVQKEFETKVPAHGVVLVKMTLVRPPKADPSGTRVLTAPEGQGDSQCRRSDVVRNESPASCGMRTPCCRRARRSDRHAKVWR